MRWLAVMALVMVVAPATAQVMPRPGIGDPRIQVVTYDPNQVVMLQVTPGYELSLELAPDERIENVAVGDSGAWQVVPNKRGDHLFIKPVDSGVTTNMTVVTDARTYLFELVPGSNGTPAYTVRFEYPPPPSALASKNAQEQIVARYVMHGSKDIRPDAIHDDGQKTYIIWRADQQQPAVFAIDARGQETLVNGAMREGRYVVDSVADKLVFRLDKKAAIATRRQEQH